MPKPVLAATLFRIRAVTLGWLSPIALAPWIPMVNAEEAQIFPCGPADRAIDVAKATGGGPFVKLSGDQFQFVRGLFVMAPDTPASLPPGDRAAISMRADGSASIVFLDGDQACAPMKLGKDGVDLLMQVGRGDVVHSGGRL